ncbi:CRAL/TRIO domain-containing protein [Myriangium duriaei CBS 260.36]|uniref:Phosphatidylinositol transfer protein SFH5 n=1 Tax=Myriangium duriaei CBS 260.36 TaxID=1168546 RepID=A0A9P4MFB7_9PEZI|nr:CRAL/TRIO domain-containing protein [Myriangium duriaei CBS 260.36]
MTSAEAEVGPVTPTQESQPAAPGVAAPAANAPTGLDKSTPLGQLASKLGHLLESTDHSEMYGVELHAWNEGSDLDVPQQVILQKFLRANSGDATKAAEQLEAALKWRKEFQPLKTVEEVFDKSRFEGLGYVTELKGVPGSPNPNDVAVFNIYGAVKDNKKTFGDLDGFIRWRVALMEMTLSALHLNDAKAPLPDFGKGPDPYQAVQIHDYLSVSFLRQAPEVKAASSKTIQLFQANYPETMARKFFVNVPIFMQWMFAAMQIFMAKETVAKMKWMSYGTELHKDLGSDVPKAYGGSGAELVTSSRTPKYDGPSATQAPEATKTEQPAPSSSEETATPTTTTA